MTRVLNSGPNIIAGPLLSPGAGAPEYNNDASPGITYQGDAFPDWRFMIQKDYVSAGGVILAHTNSPWTCLVNATPVAASTTGIAAAAATTSGTAMALATTSIASGGISPGVPFANPYTGTVVTGTVIEAGFTTGTTTAGNATIASIPAIGMLQLFVGQWLVIPNVGNSAGTTALITQVTSIASASSITVSPAPSASLAGARIGQGNLFSNLWGGSCTGLVNYQIPASGAAVGAFLDPAAAVTRCISITATNAGATGGAFTVKGYDAYGVPMSETITHAGGATTKYGRKAFKVVTSVTPGFTDAQTYSVGVGDMVGLNIRTDLWEQLTLQYAGAAISTSTGWVAADTTSPQTATNQDARGQLNIGSLNNAGAGIAGGALNGARRIVCFVALTNAHLLAATPANPAPIYGVTQA